MRTEYRETKRLLKFDPDTQREWKRWYKGKYTVLLKTIYSQNVYRQKIIGFETRQDALEKVKSESRTNTGRIRKATKMDFYSHVNDKTTGISSQFKKHPQFK